MCICSSNFLVMLMSSTNFRLYNIFLNKQESLGSIQEIGLYDAVNLEAVLDKMKNEWVVAEYNEYWAFEYPHKI